MFEKRSRAMSDNSTQQNANADGVGQFYYNYNGDLRNQDDYDEETIRNNLLSGRVDSSLQPPDMGVIQQEIYRRSRAAMEAINPSLAKQILPQSYDKLSKEEEAAICIQKYFRGYLARQLYVELLYNLYEQEEEERLQRMREQVEEGQLLIENYRLGKEMEETSCLRRNQRRGVECSVVTIQRAWRDHRQRSLETLGSCGSPMRYKPEFVAIDPRSTVSEKNKFSIRTNPFDDDGSNESDNEDLSDVFNDSLEQVHSQYQENEQSCNGQRSQKMKQDHSNIEYYHELKVEPGEFDEGLDTTELVSSPTKLPSPTTDWESIESCLTSENDAQDFLDNNQLPDFPDTRLTGLSLKPNDLQICFVDDALLHETEDEDGYDIKEYIIQKEESDPDSKRDSGCVAGDDETDNSSFSIKTVEPHALGKTVISQEDTHKILLELHDYEEEGVRLVRREQAMKGWTFERLEELNMDELRALQRNMAQCIEAQNEVLVMELVRRDELHLEQDSLLMDVEDSSKVVQAQHRMAQRVRKR